MAINIKKLSSVRSKIVAIIILSIVALSILIYVISTSLLLKSYHHIERDQTVQNVGRASDAVANTVAQLTVKLTDWAWWDDTYKFIQDNNDAYIESNLGMGSISNLKINTIVFIDSNKEIFFKKMINFSTKENLSSDSIGQYVEANKQLLSLSKKDSRVSGLVSLPEGTMLISALPILNSDGEGAVHGTLLFGKFLDSEMVSSLGELTHLSVQTYPHEGSLLPEDVSTAKKNLLQQKVFTQPLSRESIGGYTILRDIYDKPILILKVETPREVYNQGLRTFYYFMIIASVAILGFGVTIILLIEIFFTSRFSRLSKEVESIGETKDFSGRILERNKDEFGILATTINKMLAALASSQEAQKQSNINLKEQVLETEKSKLAILNLLEDIEEEKRKVEVTVVERTKELSSEKARLLASINSLSFGFIIADTKDNIILKNKAMIELLNIPETHTVTIADITRIFGEHMNFKNEMERCNKNKKICEIKDIIFGSKILRGFVAPIIDETETIGYVLLFEDITEAKVIERSREEFFAVASHELRTPLTAIRGNMAIFRDYSDTMEAQEKKEIIDDTYDASVRLIGIVNDFLDTSRLEQGKTTFKKEPIDLLPIIRETCSDLDTLAKSKSLTLTFVEPKGSIPAVFADHDRTKQAISNFVDNAIKYTEKGSVTITVKKEGDRVSVYVTDTGKGISPENQPLLFRKFQQAGEEMLARDVSKSTGLGLYITKLVIEAMGGAVGLEKSVLGQGSTFKLSIPIAR